MLARLLPRRTAVALAVLTVLLCAVFVAVSASAATTPKGGPRAQQASTSCLDIAISDGGVFTSPGPGPGYSNVQIGSVSEFQGVALTCHFYNNVGQGKWYGEIPKGHYGNNQYGYVWVQRLNYGSNHQCDDGSIHNIGGTACPLTPVNN